MATVKVERRCGGPFHWETVDGSRKLTKMDLCGTPVSIEYDDDNPVSTRLGELVERIGFCCEKCSDEAERLTIARDRRIKKHMELQRAGGFNHKKSGSKEFTF